MDPQKYKTYYEKPNKFEWTITLLPHIYLYINDWGCGYICFVQIVRNIQ